MSSELKTKGLSKHELGQFFTPPPIAEFMASLFAENRKEWQVLDAGAGAGSLSVALAKSISERAKPNTSIKVTAFELDSTIISTLRKNFEEIREECTQHKSYFSANILNADFIECASSIVRNDLFSPQSNLFNAAILNPPYRKISSNSHTRKLLRSVGIETSNLYSAFLALAIKLLRPSGELVAIVPRSFCNGPYFLPFRRLLLENMAIRQIHVFESRTAAFANDDVLQENIIIHAVKSEDRSRSIAITSSRGVPSGNIVRRECSYNEVISPTDPDAFIHILADKSDLVVRSRMSKLSTTIEELGLLVSTGRVVDFRASDYLARSDDSGVVPLLRPCHIGHGTVKWPASKERKLCAILDVEATKPLLVPQGCYVLVKRFSAKEERRRIVAGTLDTKLIQSKRIGFENHLNFFHANGEGFDGNLARGLTTFLNSSLVDSFFRHFSGHTQVNATDLRRIPYPSRAKLISIGKKTQGLPLTQSDIDSLVESEGV